MAKAKKASDKKKEPTSHDLRKKVRDAGTETINQVVPAKGDKSHLVETIREQS